MKDKIVQLHKLQKDIEALDKLSIELGKSIFGDSFEGSLLTEDGDLLVFQDCGLEFEVAELILFDKDGEEIET